MKQAGIVIVTFNSEQVIGACLRAALERCPNVLVVDNASRDRTLDVVRGYPAARLIANPANRGFAAAANQGVATLERDPVLLLNPDAVLLTGLEDMIQALDEPRVGAVGGKLVDLCGRPQRGFAVRRFPTPLSLACEVLGLNRIWPSNPVNRHYRCLDLSSESPADVEQPAGAFLMLRRPLWLKLGGMDESFFPLWFEDVDLLRRIADCGYYIRYVPSAIARHQGGHSLDRLPLGCRRLYWYASLLRYSSKHFRWLGRNTVCVAVVMGSLLRLLLETFRERNLNAASVYGKVIRLASRCFVSGRIGGLDGSPLLAT